MKTFLAMSLILGSSQLAVANTDTLQLQDIFNLEYTNQIDITEDGKTVYFVRNRMDIKTDRKVGNIWSVDYSTGQLQPLTSGVYMDYSPVVSPDGQRLAFISNRDGSNQIYIKWLKTGAIAKVSNLTSNPSSLTWTPDSNQLVFSMFVPMATSAPVSLTGKPKGATWAEPAKYIDDVYYRADGGGYTEKGFSQLFTLDANGGNAQQLTNDNFNNGGEVSFSKDGKTLYFSANRNENNELKPTNTELYQLDLDSLAIFPLTERNGPDQQPKVSPDGKYLAYTGYDDKRTNYENTQLYIRDLKTGNTQSLTTDFDRSLAKLSGARTQKGFILAMPMKGKLRWLINLEVANAK